MRTIRVRHPEGKNASAECPIAPDHEVRDFAGLMAILRDVYRVAV